MMLFFATGGSLIGMFEETLPYIAILVPLAVALGFDAMTGAAIVLLGASVGFTSAVMNPFTIGIAQGIAELPPFSGMGLRIVIFIVMYLTAVAFVYRHAMKVKKNPALGIYGSCDPANIDQMMSKGVVFERRHKVILTCFLLNMVTIAIGVIEFGWYITEIAGLFILLGAVVGISCACVSIRGWDHQHHHTGDRGCWCRNGRHLLYPLAQVDIPADHDSVWDCHHRSHCCTRHRLWPILTKRDEKR